MLVVIPSNRALSLRHFAPLIDSGARFIVVDDSPGTLNIDHPQFSIYTWNDQDRMLGPDRIAIPRGNGACRDFGFFIAWRESDPGEIVVALDDDCVVESADFPQWVEYTLSDTPRPVGVGAGPHFNILDCYQNVEDNIFPRGFPYSHRATYEKWAFAGASSGEVKFNVGLWREIFDVNAIDKIRGPRYTYPSADLRHASVVVPAGALISACSMNMQFRREMIPAAYQLLMNVEVMPGWVVDRYGDIWGGFILKTLMDINGDLMAVGGPMIRHLKEGAHDRNIWQEHVCHLLNDEFIALLARARTQITPGDYVTMMRHLADILDRERERCSVLLQRYLDRQVPAVNAWARILSRA